MNKQSTKKLILLDADVISHFISGGSIDLLPSIFKYPKVILDIVANELRQAKKFKDIINNLIASNTIQEINFENDKQIIFEYVKLRKIFGKGESACMAYCKFNKDILASSNLKDIYKYCETNNIQYLTTMDFLVEALKIKLLTEAECDLFIKNVKLKGSKLPVNTINEYINNYKIRTLN